MNYAFPTVELIKFDHQDVMIYSGEKGELKPAPLGELSIRDIEDI